jgi:hypothetical protein
MARDKLAFAEKLVKSNYGSKDKIIERGEFMFSECVKEMDELPFSMDLLYVIQLTTLRNKAELINYILTGKEIPKRGSEDGQ